VSPPSHKRLDQLVKAAPALSHGTWDEGWTLRVGHFGGPSSGITASLHLIIRLMELFSCKKILK